MKDQLVTGLPSMGLKTVAPLAGFSWRGADVGGDLAMVRYVEATADEDAARRTEAQQWILAYNEDDVRATAALREWLDRSASRLPSIDDADANGVLSFPGRRPALNSEFPCIDRRPPSPGRAAPSRSARRGVTRVARRRSGLSSPGQGAISEEGFPASQEAA